MKQIDTIKMIREIREKQYSEIKNKSNKEIIEYFQKKVQLLKKEITKVGNIT